MRRGHRVAQERVQVFCGLFRSFCLTRALIVVVVFMSATVTTSVAMTPAAEPAPDIHLNPMSIDFGNVPIGGNLSQSLIIMNTGTAPLNIIEIAGPGAAFFLDGFVLPLTLAPSEATAVSVAFLPTLVGPASGDILIVSDASVVPVSVPVSGTGIDATFTLGIYPASLAFDDVTTATSSVPQDVTITNTDNSSVSISQITLSGTGYTMTGGSAPVTLTPSQSITLSVQFSPSVAGLVNGTISIVSNASGSPASVSLTGTGVVPVQHSVALTWNESTSTVAGYNVYCSTVSGGPYAKINSSLVAALNYTDSTVQSGTTYYYVTTAADSSGNESVFSNEVSAAIP
jgi:Abnormal spindle-like microcephaly-assoc'd, ASPM-SPD-2-Hydin/Transmembrane protein 131-like N-terminal